MQLAAVAIYRGLERRVVRFKLGQLNVVTGWPGTGKSALLDIVEYCLGRTEPTFARGALDVVEWYGLLVDHEGHSIFVARPAPSPGAGSSQTAMVSIGAVDVAEPGELVPNASADTIREALSSILGIDDNTSLVPETREPIRATLAQALLLCFQSQAEISNPNQLFHRANEPFVGQAIRDTLPYFLGAVDSSHLARRQRVQAIRRDLRAVRGELAELRHVQAESDTRAAALVSLASAAGLLWERTNDTADDVTSLRAILASPARPNPSPTAAFREGERLRSTRRDLSDQLRHVQEQRAALRDVREGRTAFQAELVEQRARLVSIDLMGEVNASPACPVCGQTVDRSDPATSELRERIVNLGAQLESARGLEAPRRRIVMQLRERAYELRGAIRQVDAALAALASAAEEQGVRDEGGDTGAFVRGRISEFLEALASADPSAAHALELRVEQLESELALIEEAIDPVTVARDVEARLSFVNQSITQWAQDLMLEHAEDGLRVDLTNLTIVANNRSGPIPLRRIGSAANQVGYHVVSHLALHKWFIEESRPVPRFLLLDQPEQAYYPEDLAGVRDATDLLSDLDQERVESLYRFIHDVTQTFNGAFQTVIVGHWNPGALEWFDADRVENWRQGNALVPVAWLADASTSTP
jgi:hypothetical protein